MYLSKGKKYSVYATLSYKKKVMLGLQLLFITKNTLRLCNLPLFKYSDYATLIYIKKYYETLSYLLRRNFELGNFDDDKKTSVPGLC